MPRPTTTAMTIRMILRALLPPVGGGVGAATVDGTTGADGPAGAAAPHLLQKPVSAFRVDSPELPEAIGNLVGDVGKIARAGIPPKGGARGTGASLNPV